MKVGWQSKPFEDCIEKVTYTAKIQRKDFLDIGAFPVISQEEDFINGYWDNEDDLFRAENPLVVFGDHTKVLKYIDFDFVLGADGVKLLPPKEFLVPKFFYYQLQTAELDSLGYARHYKLLKELEIKYPDRAEQHRIVAILDEAFDGIATAKANAEQNLQNARSLFESHLQTVFTERGEGWVEKRLGDVCIVKDGTHDSPKYVDDGIPFVTQKNIRDDGLSFENTKFISQEDHDNFYRRSNVARGDILISMIGANRGMACIVDDSRTFSIKNVGLVKRAETIDHHFLLFFLKSPQAANYVRAASKGGAQEFVGLTQLRAWHVPIPPLGQQKLLAEQFVSLRNETQRLESLYRQKLAALDELKKSLLHQAFSGAL